MIGVLVAVLFSVWTADALATEPYVVYTANRDVNGAVVLRTDPANGSTVEISRNGPLGTLFQHPYDLAVEADGSLVIADMGVIDEKDGSVIRVDPVTGRQSVVSSGGAFYDPAGIAIGPGGVLYVLDNLAGSNSGAVIRVDPDTGAQQVIASNFSGTLFDFPFGIAVQGDGGIVIVNRAVPGPLPELGCLAPTGRVFRLEPGTWHQDLISELLSLSRPLGVAIDTDGVPVVANECGTPTGVGLVRVVSPILQVPVASNGPEDFLRTPERVAVTPAGDYLVSDFSLGPDLDGGVVKVARGNQAQSVVSSDSLFNHPLGIAVVRNRPPTAALAINPTMVPAGKPVSLDASGSRDPEGLRLVYEWDLDGNGTYEAGSGTTPTAMPRFAGDGLKTVRVRVNDPHGGRAIAEGTLTVDGSSPVLAGVRASAHVLGVPSRRKRAHRRAAAAGRTPPRSTTLRFRLSEAAIVTLAIDRARKGRRLQGKACSVRPKRGPRCTVWSRARKLRRSFYAGENGMPLRARGLKPGRYRVVVTAADKVGNRSPRRTVGLRVVRLPR